MNKSQIIDLYDQDQRKNVEYPDTRREVTPNVVRHIKTSDIGEGMIVYSQLSEANAEDVIRQQVSYFGSVGQDFEWKVYDYEGRINDKRLSQARAIYCSPGSAGTGSQSASGEVSYSGCYVHESSHFGKAWF